MEEQKEILAMLELIMAPAFCVKDGVVTQANQAAQQMMIEPDAMLAPMIGADMDAYGSFTEGCLCLTLNIAGIPTSASVRRINDVDIFVLDQFEEDSQMQAFALAAHSLRIPLADILGETEQLATENPEALARIRHRLVQMNRLILNMSDISRYSNGRAHLGLQNVSAVVDEIFERAEALVSQTGITMHYEVPEENILCLIDKELLERAIHNLISNSLKFTDQGGHIEAKLYRREKRLYLQIRDNGSGIPAAVLNNIFTRFKRQPGLESPQNGLGIGMSLVRAAAAAHMGTVLVTQPECGGTQITLSFPIRTKSETDLQSNTKFSLWVDYAGEQDHGLLELSDALPHSLYKK